MLNKLSVAIAGLAIVGGGMWLVFGASAEAAKPAYQDAEVIAQGAQLYDEFCASCHRADLSGEPNWRTPDRDGYLPAPPHDETGHTWHHPDVQLAAIVKHGTEQVVGGGYKSRMIGFGGVMEDNEIQAVLGYIKSTWPAEVIRRHNAINSRAGG